MGIPALRPANPYSRTSANENILQFARTGREWGFRRCGPRIPIRGRARMKTSSSLPEQAGNGDSGAAARESLFADERE